MIFRNTMLLSLQWGPWHEKRWFCPIAEEKQSLLPSLSQKMYFSLTSCQLYSSKHCWSRVFSITEPRDPPLMLSKQGNKGNLASCKARAQHQLFKNVSNSHLDSIGPGPVICFCLPALQKDKGQQGEVAKIL